MKSTKTHDTRRTAQAIMEMKTTKMMMMMKMKMNEKQSIQIIAKLTARNLQIELKSKSNLENKVEIQALFHR